MGFYQIFFFEKIFFQYIVYMIFPFYAIWQKIACLTNYQEKRSFPWHLVLYNWWISRAQKLLSLVKEKPFIDPHINCYRISKSLTSRRFLQSPYTNSSKTQFPRSGILPKVAKTVAAESPNFTNTSNKSWTDPMRHGYALSAILPRG